MMYPKMVPQELSFSACSYFSKDLQIYCLLSLLCCNIIRYASLLQLDIDFIQHCFDRRYFSLMCKVPWYKNLAYKQEVGQLGVKIFAKIT